MMDGVEEKRFMHKLLKPSGCGAGRIYIKMKRNLESD